MSLHFPDGCFFFWNAWPDISYIRAQVEELEIDEESLAYLGEIGQQASLRLGLTCLIYNSRCLFF